MHVAPHPARMSVLLPVYQNRLLCEALGRKADGNTDNQIRERGK